MFEALLYNHLHDQSMLKSFALLIKFRPPLRQLHLQLHCCCYMKYFLFGLIVAGVTGRFPRLWAGLTSLQVLDVSGTGVASKLPDSWASLQQLQVRHSSWLFCNNLNKLQFSNTM
jgi:hypothetical protein